MSFFSWLRNRTSTRSPRRRAPHRAAAAPFRPQLVTLEDRCVPSTLKVTNLADSGKGSLRYEIAQAKSGDTIVFATKLSGAITLTSGELLIDKSLTIQGPGAGLLTVTTTQYGSSSSDGPSRIFDVGSAGATVTLSGMTISGGDGQAHYIVDPAFGPGPSDDGLGGGILNYGTLTVSNCTLTDNSASGGSTTNGGGGIANLGGTLTVSGCTLSNNRTYGGGGGIYSTGTLTVSGSTLSGNTADSWAGGGGIYAYGTATVSGCTLTGNFGFDGGGISYAGGTMTVSGCTLTGNSAASGGAGGAIYSAGSALTVSNSLFGGNSPDNIDGSFTDGGGNTFS